MCGYGTSAEKISHDVIVLTKKKTTVRVSAKKSFWTDPRFVMGVLLIALSIAATSYLVTSARSGIAVYRATTTIVEGQPIDATNSAVVEVRLDADAYIRGGELPPEAVAQRTIVEGELMTRAAVINSEDRNRRHLVMTVGEGLPDTTPSGTALELWFVADSPIGATQRPAPEQLASNAILIRFVEDSGVMSRQGETRIEVLLNNADIPQVLAALNASGKLAAVPVGRS
ncbi:MAG: hypothetical protein CSA82_02815 [Actinobacteria bacterium]|nr:MAG: hypothetical protein CSA82_02815 [Actinomycetota bacterium]